MTTTKYFAYVDAPLDLATPVADVVALFTDAVWLAGAAFTGLRFTAPTHINESIYGVLVEDAFSFTSIIASPDSGIPARRYQPIHRPGHRYIKSDSLPQMDHDLVGELAAWRQLAGGF